jgi:diacylglycerol kinase family enzyme
MSLLERSATTQTHVLLAANPRAGSGRRRERLEQLVVELRSHGLVVESAGSLEEMASLAREWHASGKLRAVIAAGGDGTVAEVVNRTVPGVPVAVFPLGTANLLAHYLQIDTNPVVFAQMVAAGRRVRLDAGRAGERIFLLMVGCGFDAHVVHELHEARAGHISHWSYAKPILSAIRSYEYPQLRVYCDSKLDDAPTAVARWAFVFNLPCYAGGLEFTPLAVGTDGKFDVCTFDRGGMWNGLRYLSSVWGRWHGSLPDCAQRHASRIRIESDRPVAYQLDGDPGGLLPVEIENLPGRLTLIVPPDQASRFESEQSKECP